MTVRSSAAKAGPYEPNGQSRFPFNFEVLGKEQVLVYVGTVALDTLDGYSVELEDGGGTVVFSTPPTKDVTIFRNVEFSQEVDLQNNTAFLAEVLEDALDKVTMMCQQLKADIALSIKMPVNATATADEYQQHLYTSVEAATAAAAEAVEEAAGIRLLASSFKAVATTGSYKDLTDLPKINNQTLVGNITIPTGGSGGSGGGVTAYGDLTDKPKINDIELDGNITLTASDVGAIALEGATSTITALGFLTEIPNIYVKTVNSVTPDANGNITLTAADVGALAYDSNDPTATKNIISGLGFLTEAPIKTVNSVTPNISGNVNLTASDVGAVPFIDNATLKQFLIQNVGMVTSVNGVSGTSGDVIIPTGGSGGSGGGVTAYGDLTGKPTLNGVSLNGTLKSSDVFVMPYDPSDTATTKDIISGLGFLTEIPESTTTVKTVNSVTPNTSGNITLTAADVGALSATNTTATATALKGMGFLTDNELPSIPTSFVTSINKKKNDVTLTAADVGALSATNTTATAAALKGMGFLTDNELPDIPDLPDSYVTSVNNKKNDVTLTAADVGALAYDSNAPAATKNIISGLGFLTDAPVKTVNSVTPDANGNIKLTAADVGALSASNVIPTDTAQLATNGAGYITMADVPVKSVNGKTGDVEIPVGGDAVWSSTAIAIPNRTKEVASSTLKINAPNACIVAVGIPPTEADASLVEEFLPLFSENGVSKIERKSDGSFLLTYGSLCPAFTSGKIYLSQFIGTGDNAPVGTVVNDIDTNSTMYYGYIPEDDLKVKVGTEDFYSVRNINAAILEKAVGSATNPGTMTQAKAVSGTLSLPNVPAYSFCVFLVPIKYEVTLNNGFDGYVAFNENVVQSNDGDNGSTVVKIGNYRYKVYGEYRNVTGGVKVNVNSI